MKIFFKRRAAIEAKYKNDCAVQKANHHSFDGERFECEIINKKCKEKKCNTKIQRLNLSRFTFSKTQKK